MDELNVFVGRQPIFDRAGNVFGYELLYRDGPNNAFPQGINPEKATLELLVNIFLAIGIDSLVGRSKSFISFSQRSLEGDIIDQLGSRFVIIELLEDIEFTNGVIATLRELRK